MTAEYVKSECNSEAKAGHQSRVRDRTAATLSSHVDPAFDSEVARVLKPNQPVLSRKRKQKALSIANSFVIANYLKKLENFGF